LDLTNTKNQAINQSKMPIGDTQNRVPSLHCSTISESSSDDEYERDSVAIIGCGPGGLSFLHALATRRKKLQEEGDIEALQKLPNVTCFEMNSSPGGVWRSNDSIEQSGSTSSSDKNDVISTNMYEGLWINGCKELLEYFDYTFDEHFKCPMPVFLPRAQVLEYILKRVTKHEDIFENVLYNTTVLSVSYDKEEQFFRIKTVDGEGLIHKYKFDKCIYSAGMNAKPQYANSLRIMLQTQKYTGRIVHSSEMNKLGPDVVKGKRIMMIGDSYSAEDLALQCLKIGAERIFISSRRAEGICSEVGAWPGNRVELLGKKIPFAVQDGNTLLCRDHVEWSDDEESGDEESDEEESDSDDEDSYDAISKISDISIVIFCTGYLANFDMLSPELHPWKSGSYKQDVPLLKIPKDWKMKDNCLTHILGDVEPSTDIIAQSACVAFKLYNRMLIENTNMMFLYEASDYPLMEIDIAAWLCLAHICGDTDIPTPKEMRRRNNEQILSDMDELAVRDSIDTNYSCAMDRIPKDHWYHNELSEEYEILFLKEWSEYHIKLFARHQHECGYPVKFGTMKQLNCIGEQATQLCVRECILRHELDEDSEDWEWRTFRDCDISQFCSLFTGTRALPLKGRWIDLDDEGNILN